MGHSVIVLEAGTEPGGMAGHFDFDGTSIERYYHFVCRTDYPTFALLKELGIADSLRWRPTSMGLFHKGRLHPWGDPISLLRFPWLSLWSKLRYALFAFVCVRRNRWPSIETETARSWITRWCGAEIYDRFWKPLFAYKFYEYADEISALWIWTRIRRIGRSRKNLLQEELGYLEGGSLTLVSALIDSVKGNGGEVLLGSPAKEVRTIDGKVTGVETAEAFYPADAVICTAPTPFVSKLVPDLPDDLKQRYDAIHNIGVICVIFKLTRSVTPHFWVNVAEADIEIPGVIEFTNLRQAGPDSIVYVPYYIPVTRDKFQWEDKALLEEAFACLQRINPVLTKGDIKATKVTRLRHAQPICEAGFAAKIPQVQTPIAGLQIADTSFYYPEDRGIAESVRLGDQMARSLGNQSQN